MELTICDFLPIMAPIILGVFFACVSYDVRKKRKEITDKIKEKLNPENLTRQDGVPNYRITRLQNSHDMTHRPYKVEWNTANGWKPCYDWCGDSLREVTYKNQERCKEWIQSQLNKGNKLNFGKHTT